MRKKQEWPVQWMTRRSAELESNRGGKSDGNRQQAIVPLRRRSLHLHSLQHGRICCVARGVRRDSIERGERFGALYQCGMCAEHGEERRRVSCPPTEESEMEAVISHSSIKE
jgi:hypothetical protein